MGKVCPKCGRRTLFEHGSYLECTKCGYKMIIPTPGGKGGKGQKCPNCGKFTFFGGKCRSCGAREV